jgi:hypothetical protein
MDDEALTEAIDGLEQLAGRMTPGEALVEMDPAILQTFWREWPDASSWAGALWRLLEFELSSSAQPQLDSENDEVGGTG